MSIILAIFSGTSLGYAYERGDMCFHSTLSGLFHTPKKLDLFRAYILSLIVATPLIYLMRVWGWIVPWIPPFTWKANILGGVIFGVGMVLASSCITGFFYKLGHGMLGILVGLTTWAFGDILVFLGPLSGFRKKLTTNPLTISGSNPTVDNLFGPAGWGFLLVVGMVAIIWLLRSPNSNRHSRGKLWGWLPLGIAIGLVISVSWLLAQIGDSNYPFGTSRVPTQIYQTIFFGEKLSLWIPVTLFSLFLGAYIAARRSGTFLVRGESPRRYIELAGGGLLMGVGAALAGGCNLGHALVGVPLLSIGSIVTVLSMIVGVFLATQINKFWVRYER
ncbi:MAG: YeeE/YedE family protein [Chloroflexi bacterium]|nr:YeeE/YedE family protein [Chloroflexota bacterium]